jgi:hypothetical protein
MPDIFIDYVSAAKDNYSKYKLSAKSIELDEYFVKFVPDKLAGTKTVILSYLDGKKYTFRTKNIRRNLSILQWKSVVKLLFMQ